MPQKRLALINDMSGFGRCSITVELPIISALKVQCCPLPTSVFSNHTAYEDYYFRDFTKDMLPYMETWEKIGVDFDGICTGFLGSEAQIELVKIFFQKFKQKGTTVVVDPVMGDGGKIYATYTDKMCCLMKELLAYADICVPNLTEACILADIDYTENMSRSQLLRIAEKLSSMGPEKIAITGVVQGRYIANYCYEKGKGESFVRTLSAGEQRCGTGDVFTSIVAAETVKGNDFKKSVRKAATFVKKCIEKSVEMQIPLTDGVCFEELLTTLR